MKKFLSFTITFCLFLLAQISLAQTTPLNPSVTNITSNSATFKWGRVSNATQYKVKYTSDATWDTIALTADTFLNVTGLSSAKAYRYVVKEQLPVSSGYTAEIRFTTLSSGGGTGTCSIPNVSLFGTTNITSTSAQPYWTAVTGATSYNVQYRIRNVGAAYSTSINTLTPSITLSGLQASTNYEFIVQTVCSSGLSNFSTSGWFTTSTSSGGGTGITPTFSHVFTVVLENHGYNQIVGVSGAPNFNSYITNNTLYKTALFTNSYALTHPSEPNYFMLVSGTNQGVTNDACPVGPFNTQCIQSQLGGIGKTYIAYEEDLPSVGSTVCSSNNYVRRHCVWSYFNTVDHSKEVPFTQWNTNYASMPYFVLIIPNQVNNWHSGTLSQCDNWLGTNINGLAQWCSNPANNSLLIVTFDENDGSSGNRIPTLFISGKVVDGSYSQTINHYSVLRLWEEMNGLTKLGNASTAAKIDFCWSTQIARNEQFIGPINIDISNKLEIGNTETNIKYFNILGEYLGADYNQLPTNQIIIKIYNEGILVKTKKIFKNNE